MGENRVVYRVLVGKPEGRRPLARSRRRLNDNIKMAQESRYGGMEKIYMVQNKEQVAGPCEYGKENSCSIK